MANQAMLGPSATAFPATGEAVDHVSSVPSTPGSSGYPPGHDPALITRYVLITISFFVLTFPNHFYRYERFVREGGDADLALYFESLVPDLLAYLDPDDPKEDPQRERRSGADDAARRKREKEAKALEESQEHKLEVTSMATLGFQVPLLI